MTKKENIKIQMLGRPIMTNRATAQNFTEQKIKREQDEWGSNENFNQMNAISESKSSWIPEKKKHQKNNWKNQTDL